MRKAVIGALLGAVLGSLAWVLLGRALELELDWFVLVVGLMIGLGVSIAVGPTGLSRRTGFVAGVVALVVTSLQAAGLRPRVHLAATDELQISLLADQEVQRRTSAGESLSWPGGTAAAVPASERDYPPEVWAEASARWNSLDLQGRAANRQETLERTAAKLSALGADQRGLAGSSLFACGALLGAFRLGSGSPRRRGANVSRPTAGPVGDDRG